ncbi:hypothetical protein MLD38_016608 [Melastoma candidum]|uniref:Uncharacterized protein n=2 Tax=Melastoma candidum TaxID=119954 RepID=A0ACB9QN02_9MYRT|nr:hypothetical protein MLD38_016608 [Melastoma candidum]
MQQGGGSHSHYAPEGSAPPLPAASSHQHGLVVEEASPISSRPPAPENLEQLMPEMDAFAAAVAAEDPERGGGGGGVGGGNRWPKQETVALLKIRSEMDATFRDASLKGPLWEDVSRKMAELGYRRSAKKCKEKFENVHKYYKRTKEGRAGRQDGKAYKFFSELEALQAVAIPPQQMLAPPPVSVGLQPHPVSVGAQFGNPVLPVAQSVGMQPPTVSHVFPGVAVAGAMVPPDSSPFGLMFSSSSSSLSPGSGDDEDDEDDVEGEPSTTGSSRKRKRAAEMSPASEGRRMMMEYFEGLMKRVMQKQEEMQKRLLEAIEKREQDRLAREEAWRRQEMYRIAREHERMAQERAVTASRDAAIISFLQKITGQTIQLPTMATVTPIPVASPRAPPPPQVPATTSPTSKGQPQQQPQRQPQTYRPTPPVSREVIVAIPEQQIPPPPQEIIGTSGGGVGGSGEVPSSSRWPKAEVLALIRLRSGMESKYLDAGPKGPLWEEISAGMHQLGYKRNPKRCKEKWENINKYFKKVKESNKKRPEDAKTCPYFHELDALYRRKVLSGQSTGFEIRSEVPTNVVTEEAQRDGDAIAAGESERPKDGGPDDEETESSKKPEDTVKEMRHCSEQQRTIDFRDDKSEDATGHGNTKQDDNENEEELGMDDDDEDEEEMEESKMAYKIEYQKQRQNSGTPNGGGSGSAPSFATMVQ